MTDALAVAVKDAIPRVRASARESRHRFGYLTDHQQTVITMPAEDWARIVAIATAGDPLPRELRGSEES